MLAKIVIFTCLAVFTNQEPHLAASLPYVANYASSYDAHVINHDVRIPIAAAPIVNAITGYSPVAQLTSVVPQAIATYAAAPIAPAVAVTPQIASIPSVNAPDEAPARSTARSSPSGASEEQKSSAPGEAQRVQPGGVPNAVLLASQIFARNAANQRNAASEQNRDAQFVENQRNAAVLGATQNGYGFVERPAEGDQRKADLRAGRLQIDQRSGERANLIRRNEDSESIEVNSATNNDSPAYEVQNSEAVKPVAAPARLAAVAPSLRFLPNVYTSVFAF